VQEEDTLCDLTWISASASEHSAKQGSHARHQSICDAVMDPFGRREKQMASFRTNLTESIYLKR
jgi:hypothetical protein